MNISGLVDMVADGCADRILIGDRESGLSGRRIRQLSIGGARAIEDASADCVVYFGTNGAPDYGSPVATILYSTSLANGFTYNSATLTSNVTYTIGVRAANATATETNTNTVTVTANATGPTAVVSLTAVARS